VRTYSGGMKRRLSVAISLIGDPKVHDTGPLTSDILEDLIWV
jgi:ABC-type phosphonate transport system ATPase subunit